MEHPMYVQVQVKKPTKSKYLPDCLSHHTENVGRTDVRQACRLQHAHWSRSDAEHGPNEKFKSMAPITNGDPILRRLEKNRLVVILSRSYQSEGGAE